MAETYLNLLNSAAAVSANVYDQIDKSMTQRLNIEAQAGKFEVDAMAKAAQFAETQRMNDEQIINMRAGNYLQAQKLEAEKMLMPIKIETANLQLENQRLALQRAKEQEGKNHFNSLTSIYDDQIGYALLQTESPEMAQEYIGYKAKVSDYVAKGGKFDPTAFEESLKTIRSKYDAVHPSSVQQVEYNPQTSYLLGQVSPKLQSEYDKRHPLVQGSRNSVANNFYNMDDKALGAFMNSGTLDKLYQTEEIGQLWTGRIAVQQNYADIERWNRELDRERNGKAAARARMADPSELIEYDKNIAQYSEQIRTAMDQNMKIAKDSSMGKYGIQAPIVPPVSGGTQQKTTDISGFDENPKLGHTPPKYPSLNADSAQITQAINDTHAAVADIKKDAKGNLVSMTPIEQTELSQVDLSWATGNSPTMHARSNIKTEIGWGISKLIGDDINEIGRVVTPEKINNLLGTLESETQIPISKALEDLLIKNKAYLGTSTPGAHKYAPENDDNDTVVMTFGPKSEHWYDDSSTVRSADQILTAINKIKNPTERAYALREVYESLGAASLTNKITRKEDR